MSSSFVNEKLTKFLFNHVWDSHIKIHFNYLLWLSILTHYVHIFKHENVENIHLRNDGALIAIITKQLNIIFKSGDIFYYQTMSEMYVVRILEK